MSLRAGARYVYGEMSSGLLPPYSVGPDSLFVAFYASAEIGCHLALGWPKPARILDLFTEFRCHTNGAWDRQKKAGLLDALIHFGIPCIDAAEKDEMRALALRGGPWSEEERLDLLNYCEGDVDSLAKLLPAMLPDINLPFALVRGRYMAAVATMEHNGTPIDVDLLDKIRDRWDDIKDQLIRRDRLRIWSLRRPHLQA